MRASLVSAAAVAALVGYGGTIALVLAAAQAVGATPVQTVSWLFAISLAKAIGSAGLSLWTRIPVVLAWSTPGAALIASSEGIGMAQAVAAFVVAGGLIALTGAFRTLGRMIGAIPDPLAAAMLGGVLLPFCLAVPGHAVTAPGLVLPVVGVFLVVRMLRPAFAVLAALATGLVLSFAAGASVPTDAFRWPVLTFIAPEWSWGVAIGLGVPLFIVTMASQNLPGFAILRAAGYEPPVSRALTVSGGLSTVAAFFGAHPINMAAITAAICLGDDVHLDRAQRWKVGLAYGGFWAMLAIFGPFVLAFITAMPPALIATVAGLALINPLIGAATSAFAVPDQRFAAMITLLVTASGVTVGGIGGAFWGLIAGLAVHVVERLCFRAR